MRKIKFYQYNSLTAQIKTISYNYFMNLEILCVKFFVKVFDFSELVNQSDQNIITRYIIFMNIIEPNFSVFLLFYLTNLIFYLQL